MYNNDTGTLLLFDKYFQKGKYSAYIQSGYAIEESLILFKLSELEKMESSKRFEELLEEY